MKDGEKSALIVGGAIAVVAILFYLADAQGSPGGFTLPAPFSGASYGTPSTPILVPSASPVNTDTGVSSCDCGCAGNTSAYTGSLAQLSQNYFNSINQTESQYLADILNTYVNNGVNGSNSAVVQNGTVTLALA